MLSFAHIAWWILVVVAAVVAVVVGGISGFHTLTGLSRRIREGAVDGHFVATLREHAAFVRIISWGFRPRSARNPADIPADTEVVVVFVHGAMADGSCTTGWQRALAGAGIDEDVGVAVVAPDHGVIIRDLEAHTRRVHDVMADVQLAAPGAHFVFVAHSMGGLVVRQLLAGDERLRKATLGAVTVASPHAGTASLRSLPFGFPHLREGHAGLRTLPPLSSLVEKSWVVGSAVDNIVYPKTTSLSPGSEPISFDSVGHAALLVDAGVGECIAGLVASLVADHKKGATSTSG